MLLQPCRCHCCLRVLACVRPCMRVCVCVCVCLCVSMCARCACVQGGKATVGIFRVSSDAARMKKLQAQIDSGDARPAFADAHEPANMCAAKPTARVCLARLYASQHAPRSLVTALVS